MCRSLLIALTNAVGTSAVGRTSAPFGAPVISLPGVIAGDLYLL